jgi:hypothetical protein
LGGGFLEQLDGFGFVNGDTLAMIVGEALLILFGRVVGAGAQQQGDRQQRGQQDEYNCGVLSQDRFLIRKRAYGLAVWQTAC